LKGALPEINTVALWRRLVLEQLLKRWNWFQLLIAGLSVLLALLMLTDVISSITTGQYLSRQEGLAPYVGRWFLLFFIRGVVVVSAPVQTLFFVWSGLLIIMSAVYLWQPARAWGPMILLALLSFWYFPLGSWFGLAIIVLLAWDKVQRR
jgi:hypothetical protein